MTGIRSKGRPHHTTVPNWRLEDPDIDSVTLHIAAWIASHTSDYCADYVTRNEIARRTGVGGPTVSARLARLAALGIIEIEQGAQGRFVIVFDHDVWQDRPGSYFPVTGKLLTGNREAPSQSTELHLYIGETQGEEQTEARFASFWDEYPRKIAKPAALRAFKTAIKKTDFEQIWSGTIRWARFWRESNTEEQFIPHPATWLNQERWNDPNPRVPLGSLNAPRERARAALEQLARRDDELS